MSNLTVSGVSAPFAGMSHEGKDYDFYLTSVLVSDFALTYSPVEDYDRSVLTSAMAYYTYTYPTIVDVVTRAPTFGGFLLMFDVFVFFGFI